MSRVSAVPVRLHIYDLSPYNDDLIFLGLGAYHSGVEVLGREYTFGSGGIFTHEPMQAPDVRLRETVDLGDVPLTQRELDGVVDQLRADFPGSGYSLVHCNCNHFADALSRRLVGRGIPLFVNRQAYLGSLVSCLLPESLTRRAPVDSIDAPDAAPRYAGAGRPLSQARTATPVFTGVGRPLSEGVGRTARRDAQ